MKLREVIQFQKTLALAASASNLHEAEAAELAARRLMIARKLDPTVIPNASLYNRMNFAGNALLAKLRDEYLMAHPRQLRGKPKPVVKPVNTNKPKPVVKPVNTNKPDPALASPAVPFNIEGFRKPAKTTKPADTTPDKSRSDRNRDRHRPGYMRDYMRRRRA